ncbi:Fructose-bisphosphate aldolase [Reticulomyxa filosa]|uniref:fructose-bisphosphate aldolase n=1 Tax=Reticulomyxa filosa TaxID=46433 RepID=X6N9C8_RETFI|nr:Fructose-bisphosphate aldolase [Reticulomyxa filosa]|eukprot:ETO21887.1 Fructose-bisphosphate aldolase [Reticulomyxa filosa]
MSNHSKSLELINNLIDFVGFRLKEKKLAVNALCSYFCCKLMTQAEHKESGPATIWYKNPHEKELIATAVNYEMYFLKAIAERGKGILAADESTGTIGKRFDTIKVANEENNRRKYRQLLFTTPDIGKYISGVILYDETIRQKTDDGVPFVEVLKKAGVIPGIKVDLGTKDIPSQPGEVYTQGLTDLDKRTAEYYKIGARFAKWCVKRV